MQEFLKALQRRIRTAFLFVTHDQEEAITMSDRIVVMRQGAIEQVGTPQDIYWRPRTAFVAGFVGDNNLIEVEAEPGADGLRPDPGAFGLPWPCRQRPAPAGGACWPCVQKVCSSFADEPAEDMLVLTGEAQDLVFSGGTSRLMVKLAALPGQPLRVQLTSRPGGEAPAPGSAVRIGFRPAEAALVPA